MDHASPLRNLKDHIASARAQYGDKLNAVSISSAFKMEIYIYDKQMVEQGEIIDEVPIIINQFQRHDISDILL